MSLDLKPLRSACAALDGKRLVIEKADGLPRFTRRDLVKALHKRGKRAVDLGPPRGREIL